MYPKPIKLSEFDNDSQTIILIRAAKYFNVGRPEIKKINDVAKFQNYLKEINYIINRKTLRKKLLQLRLLKEKSNGKKTT